MDDDAEFLRAQAVRCRWLADRINAGDVVDTLRRMAHDYEARAAAKERDREEPEPP